VREHAVQTGGEEDDADSGGDERERAGTPTGRRIVCEARERGEQPDRADDEREERVERHRE
jgi:hypothetical protein